MVPQSQPSKHFHEHGSGDEWDASAGKPLEEIGSEADTARDRLKPALEGLNGLDPAWVDWQTAMTAEFELLETIRSVLAKSAADRLSVIVDSDEPEDMCRFLLEISQECERQRHVYLSRLSELLEGREQIKEMVETAMRDLRKPPKTA